MSEVVMELSVGALRARLSSREIPENRMPDGRVVGLLEAARASGTLPLLVARVTAALEAALAVYAADLDAVAAARRGAAT